MNTMNGTPIDPEEQERLRRKAMEPLPGQEFNPQQSYVNQIPPVTTGEQPKEPARRSYVRKDTKVAKKRKVRVPKPEGDTTGDQIEILGGEIDKEGSAVKLRYKLGSTTRTITRGQATALAEWFNQN